MCGLAKDTWKVPYPVHAGFRAVAFGFVISPRLGHEYVKGR
jgi:hypothetical protein